MPCQLLFWMQQPEAKIQCFQWCWQQRETQRWVTVMLSNLAQEEGSIFCWCFRVGHKHHNCWGLAWQLATGWWINYLSTGAGFLPSTVLTLRGVSFKETMMDMDKEFQLLIARCLAQRCSRCVSGFTGVSGFCCVGRCHLDVRNQTEGWMLGIMHFFGGEGGDWPFLWFLKFSNTIWGKRFFVSANYGYQVTFRMPRKGSRHINDVNFWWSEFKQLRFERLLCGVVVKLMVLFALQWSHMEGRRSRLGSWEGAGMSLKNALAGLSR